MKKDKNKTENVQPAAQTAQPNDSRVKRIHLTLVTEEEREKYRVPCYDYLL